MQCEILLKISKNPIIFLLVGGLRVQKHMGHYTVIVLQSNLRTNNKPTCSNLKMLCEIVDR